jgi:HAD superfamily hydrolase (TIGR01509 family)
VIEAIFFDNDGVLVDTEGHYFEANRLVFEEHGHVLERDVFIDLSLRQGRSVFDWIRARGADDDTVQALRARRDLLYRERVGRGVEVYEGVAETLEGLADHYPMAIVTSALRADFELAHRDTGLLHHFEFVLASGEYARHKPHPDPYLEAAERLGVDPRRCVVVEDSVRGLQAAVAAGMACLAIPHALTAGGDFSQAAAVLSSIREVPDAVGRVADRLASS